MALLSSLEPLKARIDAAERATREDIYEALLAIRDAEEDRDAQITLLVADLYSPDKTAKLLTSLDSYDLP